MPRNPKAEHQTVLVSSHATIGAKIAKLRKSRAMTQKDLADKIGVTRTVITDYECGRVRIYDEMLARLAAVLQTSADEILGLKNTSAPIDAPLRLVRRIREIEKLSNTDQKALLKTIDKYLSDSARQAAE